MRIIALYLLAGLAVTFVHAEEAKEEGVGAPGGSSAKAHFAAHLKEYIAQTQDKNDQVRLNAVLQIASFGPAAKSAAPVLIERLKDKGAHVKRGDFSLGDVIFLFSFSSTRGPEEYSVASCAAQALAAVHAEASQAVPALVEMLAERDEYLRDAARGALQIYGKEASTVLPPLTEMLCKHKETRARVSAARTLKDLGPDALAAQAALVEALGDSAKDVRWAAAEALARVGPLPKASILLLVGNLKDRECLWGACRTAGALGLASNAEDVVPHLFPLLKNEDKDLRRAAVETLLIMGKNARTASVALTAALKDEDEKVRVMTAQALGRIGFEAKDAAPALAGLFRDRRNAPRIAAAEALRLVSNDPTIIYEPYRRALNDDKAEVRREAVRAMTDLGPGAANAVPVLVALLEKASSECQESAASALGAVGGAAHAAVPHLISALSNSYIQLRRNAAEALGKICAKPDTAVPALTAALGDNDLFVRENAALALGCFGSSAISALPMLDKMAASGESERVRDAAKAAIVSMGIKAATPIPPAPAPDAP